MDDNYDEATLAAIGRLLTTAEIEGAPVTFTAGPGRWTIAVGATQTTTAADIRVAAESAHQQFTTQLTQ